MKKTYGLERYIRYIKSIYVLKYILWKIQEYKRHTLNYYKILNPSIIDYRGKRLIVFRDYVPKNSYVCIGELKGEKILNIKRILGKAGSWSAEDPRFFIHKDKLHVSYVVGKWNMKAAPGGYGKMAYCALGEDLSVGESHIFDNFAGIQKNWLFFESPEKKLYAITHVCNQEIFDIQNDTIVHNNTLMKWPSEKSHQDNAIIGAIRGGSTPVLIDGIYYSFFHVTPIDTKTGDKKIHYCYEMGCYAFESSPPFKILSYTPKPLFTGNPYILPNGAIFKNGKWLVSCGINDSDWKLLTFDHKNLLESMISI